MAPPPTTTAKPPVAPGPVSAGLVSPGQVTGAFPADRDRYVAEHGSERTVSLLLRKIAGWGARRLPSVRLRRLCLRCLGIALPTPDAGERPAWIGHDVYVDEVFPELVTIEPAVVIGLRAMLICHDDANRRVAPIRIGRGSYIGAGAIILPGVTVGEGAKIGAGAVVTKDVPPEGVWVGVPARPLGSTAKHASSSD